MTTRKSEKELRDELFERLLLRNRLKAKGFINLSIQNNAKIKQLKAQLNQ